MNYICGDSFGASDKKSNIIPWHEQIECRNLSRVIASNLMISRQVDTAIQENAEFIIVLFTTSARFEHYSGPYQPQALENSNLNQKEKDIISQWTRHFFNLELEIYKNKCIIESTLQRLVNSKIPFLFDQGGFEHKKWGVSKTYFENYDQYRSKYNLWDHGKTEHLRPFFHITNQDIHNEIAGYYQEQITKAVTN